MTYGLKYLASIKIEAWKGRNKMPVLFCFAYTIQRSQTGLADLFNYCIIKSFGW